LPVGLSRQIGCDPDSHLRSSREHREKLQYLNGLGKTGVSQLRVNKLNVLPTIHI